MLMMTKEDKTDQSAVRKKYSEARKLEREPYVRLCESFSASNATPSEVNTTSNSVLLIVSQKEAKSCSHCGVSNEVTI
jgi:hypothetical protein